MQLLSGMSGPFHHGSSASSAPNPLRSSPGLLLGFLVYFIYLRPRARITRAQLHGIVASARRFRAARISYARPVVIVPSVIPRSSYVASSPTTPEHAARGRPAGQSASSDEGRMFHPETLHHAPQENQDGPHGFSANSHR